jgi:hypothetical protein
MPSPRNFPPPWSAELQPNYYVVRDADGQQIAYVYYSNDPERRSTVRMSQNKISGNDRLEGATNDRAG